MKTSQNRIIITLRALRVYQWTKNLLLFAALLFAKQAGDPAQVFIAIKAFAAFCMASSATYLLNDLMDVEKDRVHPEKKNRPIASGALPMSGAIGSLLGLFAGSMALAYNINLHFFYALLVYIALTVSYSFGLKNLVIIDVLIVALGFVIRAMAGALALDVAFSNWLVVCTLFLALFLGLSKRRHEIVTLEEDAKNHRKVLNHYSVHYLDQLILIVAGATLITYTIYTCSPEVVGRLGSDKLYFTIPFVVYGLFRYLFLVHQHAEGGDPSSSLIKDAPLGCTVVLWAVACALILY
jgi:4-hydroxybenzoate polyprenyltransferase